MSNSWRSNGAFGSQLRDPAVTNKINSVLEASVIALEKTRDNLAKEVEAAETASKSYSHSQWTPSKFSLSLLWGYTLTNFTCKEMEDNVKIVSVDNEDTVHAFQLAVRMKGDIIEAVDIALPDHSALMEIGNILSTLNEECSPPLVFATIQQFIHLYSFRKRVTQKLMASSKNIIEVRPAQFGKDSKQHECTIRVHDCQSKEIVVEIQWTMRWDRAFQALIHSISPSIDRGNLFNDLRIFKICFESWAQKKLLELKGLTFLPHYENNLWDWWEDFRLTVVSA